MRVVQENKVLLSKQGEIDDARFFLLYKRHDLKVDAKKALAPFSDKGP